jgi:hypothetical protein
MRPYQPVVPGTLRLNWRTIALLWRVVCDWPTKRPDPSLRLGNPRHTNSLRYFIISVNRASRIWLFDR